MGIAEAPLGLVWFTMFSSGGSFRTRLVRDLSFLGLPAQEWRASRATPFASLGDVSRMSGAGALPGSAPSQIGSKRSLLCFGPRGVCD